MPNRLNLKRFSSTDVRFNNTFVGKLRPLEIEIAGENYSLTCHSRIDKFSSAASIGLKIAGFDSVLAMKTLPDLELFDERFSGVDLDLLPVDVRPNVATMAFGQLLAHLSAKLKVDISITSIETRSKSGGNFEREIGLTICDRSQQPTVVGNLKLNSALLELLIENFEHIPAHCEPRDCGFSLDVFLKAGQTTLPMAEFDNLEINDIIFLDDDSQLRAGKFTLCGVDSPKIVGNCEGAFFKVCDIIE